MTWNTVEDVLEGEKKGFYTQLEGLRGVAILLVIISHFIIIPSFTGLHFLNFGFWGVNIFFVLSGFVLLPTFPQNKKGFLKDYRRFVFLRAIRLMPLPMIAIFLSLLPYWFGRLVTGRSDIFVFENSNKSLDDVISGMLLLQIVFSTSIFLVIPLWSFSAEWITNLITALFGPLKSNTLYKGEITALNTGGVSPLIGVAPIEFTTGTLVAALDQYQINQQTAAKAAGAARSSCPRQLAATTTSRCRWCCSARSPASAS